MYVQPHNSPPTCKVVLLGEAQTGKTAIITRLISNKFESLYTTTIGTGLSTYDCMVNDKKIRLNIWDTAGQERYRSLAEVYYRDAQIVIIVYDVTVMKTLEEYHYWKKQLKKNCISKPIIFLVGNKIDCESERIVTNEDAMHVANKINATYKETSAKTGDGIQELFFEIAKVFSKIETEDQPKDNSQLVNSHSNCC